MPLAQMHHTTQIQPKHGFIQRETKRSLSLKARAPIPSLPSSVISRIKIVHQQNVPKIMFVSQMQASTTTEMIRFSFSTNQRVDFLTGSKMYGGTENENVTSPTLAAPSSRGSAHFLPTGLLTRMYIPPLTHQFKQI